MQNLFTTSLLLLDLLDRSEMHLYPNQNVIPLCHSKPRASHQRSDTLDKHSVRMDTHLFRWFSSLVRVWSAHQQAVAASCSQHRVQGFHQINVLPQPRSHLTSHSSPPAGTALVACLSLCVFNCANPVSAKRFISCTRAKTMFLPFSVSLYYSQTANRWYTIKTYKKAESIYDPKSRWIRELVWDNIRQP